MPDGAAVAVMQPDRAAPVSYQSMLQGLNLDGPLFQLLDEAFLELHLPLAAYGLTDLQDNPIRFFRVLHDQGTIALLHLAPTVLSGQGGDQQFQLLGFLFSNEATWLCFFTEADVIPLQFRRIASLWQRKLRNVQRVDFFIGADVQYLGEQAPAARARSIMDVLNLQPPTVAGLKVLNGAAMGRIVDIMAPAASASAAPKAYFRDLVNKLGGPPAWSDEMADIWTGDTRQDALTLVRWAYAKRLYPPQAPKPGYTVLGCLLEELARDVANPALDDIIRQYDLIPGRK